MNFCEAQQRKDGVQRSNISVAEDGSLVCMGPTHKHASSGHNASAEQANAGMRSQQIVAGGCRRCLAHAKGWSLHEDALLWKNACRPP